MKPKRRINLNHSKEISEEHHHLVLKIIIALVFGLSALALMSVLLANLFFSYNASQHSVFHHNNLLWLGLGLVGYFALAACFIAICQYFKVSSKSLYKMLTIFTLVMGSLIIAMYFGSFTSYLDPTDAANGMMLKSLGLPYLEVYPNERGMFLVYQAIFSVLGRQAWFYVEFLNLASAVGIFYLLPKLTFQLSHQALAERLCLFLLFSFFPIFGLIVFPYSDLLALVLVLASLYLMFKYQDKKKIWPLLGGGLLLGLACIVRTNSLIFVIGLVFYGLVRIFQGRKIAQGKAVIAPLTALLLLGLFNFGFPVVVKGYTTKYAQTSQQWMAMALASPSKDIAFYSAPGQYNTIYLTALTQYQRDFPKASQEDYARDISWQKKFFSQYINQQIALFVHHPTEAYDFFSKRLIDTWADPSLDSQRLLQTAYTIQTKGNARLSFQDLAYEDGIMPYQSSVYQKDRASLQSPLANSLANGKLAGFMREVIERPFVIFVVLLVLIYLLRKRNRLSLEISFLMVVFLGGFVFHGLIWETRARYVFPYLLVLIPGAALSLSELIKFSKK